MSSEVTSSMNADSSSNTEDLSFVHNHSWTIQDFSQLECRFVDTSTNVRDPRSVANAGTTVDPPPLIFRIRLHPQGNKESNKDFTFFQCFLQPFDHLNIKYKFTIYNSRGEEIATTVYTGTQQFHGYFEYIRRDLLVGHVLPQDELRINLELSVTFDTVTRSSPEPQPLDTSPEEDYRMQKGDIEDRDDDDEIRAPARPLRIVVKKYP